VWRQADDIAALEALVEQAGPTEVGSKGQVKVHGALAELRQARLALCASSRSVGDARCG
jgi:hypothetical protein